MGLQDLADVHPRRHAQRVEHDVDRRAVLEMRHVLDRRDLRDHALVAVPAGHLVARLQLALHRDEHLDHLEHAGRQLVAALQLLDLVVEALLQQAQAVVELALELLDLDHALGVVDADLPPLPARQLAQRLGRDRLAGRQRLGPAGRALALEQLAQTAVDVALQDRPLVVAVLGEPLDLGALDRHGALVLVDAAAREHPHLDHRAGDAGRHLERGVAHVRGLLAEDRPQQLLLGRHRRLALGRDLADQDVAGVHLGADVDDARLVEIAQALLADIGNVAGDRFRPQLGVPGHDLELLDVHRGEHVVAHDALRDQDRVLEVVAAPRHERDQHVAAERQLAEIGARAVGDDVAAAAPDRPSSRAAAG